MEQKKEKSGLTGVGLDTWLDELQPKLQQNNNRALDYVEWVRAYGSDPTEEYTDALHDAERAYRAANVKGGRAGERLSQAGLERSGYADYLAAEREMAYKRAREDADQALERDGAREQRQYRRYLAEWNENQDKLLASAVKGMLSMEFTSSDTAYRYASSLGLSDERARHAAELTLAVGSDMANGMKERYEILRGIINSGVTPETAYQLARACGMPPETAKQLAAAVQSMWGSAPSTGGAPSTEDKGDTESDPIRDAFFDTFS